MTKPIPSSTMPRHKIGKKLECAILCLLKSGSGVTQIQKLNRISFDNTRFTIINVSNGHGKERKRANLNKITRG